MAASRLDYFTNLLGVKARGRRVPPPPLPIVLPLEDSDEASPEEYGYAEGQSFTIEYIDSAGRQSIRRISVWGIKRNLEGIPFLIAQCHERRAQRSFRLDRIKTFADYDGVVYDDVPTFMQQTFGISPSWSTYNNGRHRVEDWTALRESIRMDAILLAALSHSDGLMHPSEIEVAVGHCEKAASKKGYFTNEETLPLLERYIRRLMPNEVDVINAVEDLLRAPPDQVLHVLASALRLIDADGLRHTDERRLINQVSNDLIGLPVAD